MQFSKQQTDAIDAIGRWFSEDQQVFRLFGPAGTGKSTLSKEIAELHGGKVLFGAFTGKAALVMRKKGCRGASTIHSLIYTVIGETKSGEPIFGLNPYSDVSNADLVIVDEVSMVGPDLAADLLSFGTKVLVLGDPEQLPPVTGTGYFTNTTPDFMLTEIHRQALDNPIVKMSMVVRTGGTLRPGAYGESLVMPRADFNGKMIFEADQLLVGLNRTRRAYNDKIRELSGFSGTVPLPGEKLVCLKNNRTKGLLNGGLWRVAKSTEFKRSYGMRVESEDEPMERLVSAHKKYFLGLEASLTADEKRKYDAFDFGYVLTTHKAQGSQWDTVIVFDESKSFRADHNRWLYTAITRAAESVVVVI